MLSPFRLSVCLSSVCLWRRCALLSRLNFSAISTYRKSTTRFPTSHRWTVYVTRKSPKGWHKNTISLFVPVKFDFSRKKSATKFLCVKTFSGKVATSFPYPKVHRSIAGDVPIYLKLAFKMMHPFRKRRFPKLSFKSAIVLGAFWSCFSPYDTLAIHWHPQKILRRCSQGNPSVGGFKRKRVVIYSDFWHLECENSETVLDRR